MFANVSLPLIACHLNELDQMFNSGPSVTNKPVHDITNNVVCATSKASDQPAHTRSLIRAFASHAVFYAC